MGRGDMLLDKMQQRDDGETSRGNVKYAWVIKWGVLGS